MHMRFKYVVFPVDKAIEYAEGGTKKRRRDQFEYYVTCRRFIDYM